MTYQVLARKYRPQSFHDVVGQDAVVQTIERALTTGRIAHAFLFTGSRGVGKTTLARILARCLTCEQGPTSKPCGACRMCTSITAGQAVDVVEIDGASNTGVDQVRDLQEMARYLPQLARFKIFIIDEVHMLTTNAFNALLKTLEEPPPHLKFIFATTEPHKLPVTVLSRCQRYDFRRIPSPLIVARLEAVLLAEKIAIERAGLEVIARAAEGGMRDALSLTDQVLSFAGAVPVDQGGVPITAPQVVEALGLIDRRTVAAGVDAILLGDAKAALAVVDLAFLKGFDLKQLLTLLAEELRHISVAQATGTIRGFADLADDDIARIDERARATDPRDAVRLLGMALDGIDVVARAEDPRLALELVLLKMCRRAPIGDALLISEAIVRLERLAKGMPVPPLVQREPSSSTTAHGIAVEAFAPVSLPAGPAVVAVPPVTPIATPVPSSSSAPVPAPVAAPPPSVAAPVASGTAEGSSAPPTSPRGVAVDGEDEPVIAEVREPASAPAGERGDDSEDENEDDERAVAAPCSTTASPAAAPTPNDDDEEEIDPLAGLELPGIDARWRSFVASLQRQRGGVFRMARVKRIGEDAVDLAFSNQWGVDEATRLASDPEVLAALERAFSRRLRITAVREEGGGVSIHEAEERLRVELQAKLEAHAKSHPVVQKAVALFGGEVRAVRRA